MRPEVIEAFRKEGVPETKARELVKEIKMEEVARKHVIALEVAHRKKLIEEGGKCAKCPRADMLTSDHVIPKILLWDFGVDVERTYIPENLVLLCRPCNALKSGHLDFSLPQTKSMLEKLLARL